MTIGRGRCAAAPVSYGDDVVVSFKAPGEGNLWLDAEAVVARLVQGMRSADRGVCVGLDFTYFEKSARQELLARLAGFPPPLPQRRLRTARERATGRLAPDGRDPSDDYRSPALRGGSQRQLCGLAGKPEPIREAISKPGLISVIVQEVVSLWDEPVFPLTRTRRAPRGVFRT
ncbi:MAG TPA: hypothetical protein VJV78_25505 [Polyangiales bacterium]|nr:hypothetical protein [Polyangiales bacterium]